MATDQLASCLRLAKYEQSRDLRSASATATATASRGTVDAASAALALVQYLSLYLALSLCITPVESYQWDRTLPAPLPGATGIFGTQIPLLGEHFWLENVVDSRNTSSSSSNNSSVTRPCLHLDDRSSVFGSTSPWLLLHWAAPLPGSDANTLYGMVWPPSYTRSKRAQFVPLPQIGSIPSNPGPTAAAAASSRFFAGHLFVRPGSWSSLWSIHVPSATWRPLGPSRMSSLYLCDPAINYNVSWSTSSVSGRWLIPPTGSVDDCWFSDITMPQIDEFGCPWPAARDGEALHVVNDSIILLMGDLSSTDPSGDVWRLRMDADLHAHYEHQATSRDGQYVYNSDQIKYLRDMHDPSINRDGLCPVKWELLTVGNHSPRLRGDHAVVAVAPSRRREMGSVVINDSGILISGGVGIVPRSSTRVVLGDIWLLQLEPIPRWVRVSDRISMPTYTAGQNDFLTRRAHTFGIMQVRIADFLPDTTGSSSNSSSSSATSFQLPPQLASCINSTTPAVLLSNGFSTPQATKLGYIESSWLLLPPCDVVMRSNDAIAAASAHSSLESDDCFNSSSLNWSLYFADGSFESNSNWTAVPIPLRTLAGSYAGIIQNVQYAFLPHRQQLLAVGGAVYGTGIPTPTRVYDFRSRTRYDAPSDFAPVQEVDKIIQDRPMMMYSSYSELLGRWMYIFGGCSVFDYEEGNEMWRFNVDTYEWQLVGKRVFNPNDTQETWQTPQVSANGAFWPRFAFAPTVWSETREGTPRFIYRWGGSEYLWPQELATLKKIVYGYTVCQAGFYRFDLISGVWQNITDSVRSTTRWTQSDAAAGAAAGYVRDGFIYPRLRCIASTIVIGDTVFLYGGNGFPFELTSPSTKWSNDLWKLNLTTLEWTMLYPGNLSLSQASAALVTPNIPPVISTVPYMNFPMPDGSGFGQCYRNYQLAGAWQIICQSYNMNTNSWLWHMSMPGAPTVISLDFSITLPDGRVLVVFDDSSTRANSISILQPRTWRWTTLQPIGSAFAPGPWVWRESAAMVYDPEQNRCLLWGGEVTASNNSLVSDPAVHSLDLDEVYVGQSPDTLPVISVVAHDWLATLTVKSGSVLAGRQIAARHFASVAGALIQYQQQLTSGSLTITVLDRIDDPTLHSRRTAAYAMASVPITLNITLRGSDDLEFKLGTIGVIECASYAHSGFPNCFLNLTGSRVTPHSHSMQDILIRNSHSANDGGALLVVSANMTLANVGVESSSSSTLGGAVFACDSIVRWIGGHVWNSSATLSGGAMYAVNTKMTIYNVTFYGNNVNVSASTQVFSHTRDVYGFGGAIAAIASTVSLTNTCFSRNVARVGGAIAVSGVSTLFPHTDVSLGLRTSSIWINDSTFFQNDASEFGGALFLSGIYSATSSANDLLVPTVQGALFDSNSAGARGGAIFSDDSLFVSNVSQYRSNECGDGGGAIFWQPGPTDSDWTINQPVLLPGGLPTVFVTAVGNVAAEPTPVSSNISSAAASINCSTSSRVDQVEWLSAAVAAVAPVKLLFDSACNSASYGPFIATPSANLALTKEGRRASNTLQASGAVVSPAVILQVLDAYDQVVTTENSLYVSAFPLSVFAGESATRAIKGEVVFENLILMAAPNRTVFITFTPGNTLVRYENEVALGIGRTTLPLTTSRLLYVGLQSAANSSSFAQVATCAAQCSLDLPAPEDLSSVSIMLSLTFNVSLFASSSDNVLTVSYGSVSSLSSVGSKSYYGSDIAIAAADAQANRVIKVADATTSSSSAAPASLTYQLPVPSTNVRLTLQTQDDRVGYVSGTFSFSSFCPVSFALDEQSGECLETRSSTAGSQIAIFILSAFAELLVLVTLTAVVVCREQAPMRATNLAFNLVVLVLLLLLPIAGIVFAVIPSASSNVICHARCWLGSLPVIGILSVLFAKAARVASALNSQTLKTTSARVIETRMWAFVAAVVLAQVALCLVFTLLPISRSELRAQTLGSDGSGSQRYLIRQCVLDSNTFPSWFGAQLALLGVLALGASYVSFLSRDASSVYNESFHNSNALFMLVLTATIVIPLAFLVRDSPDPILLLQGGAAAFLTIVWCAALFLPKFMQVFRASVKRDKRIQLRKIIGPPQLHVTPDDEVAKGTFALASPSEQPEGNAQVSRIVRFHHSDEAPFEAAGAASPRLNEVTGSSRSRRSPGTDEPANVVDSGVYAHDVMVSMSAELHTFVSNPSEAERQMKTEQGDSIFHQIRIKNSIAEVDATNLIQADVRARSVDSTGQAVGGIAIGRVFTAQPSASASIATHHVDSSAGANADNEMESDSMHQTPSNELSSQHPASHFAHPMTVPAIKYPTAEGNELLTPISTTASRTDPAISARAVAITPSTPETHIPSSDHDRLHMQISPPGWLGVGGVLVARDRESEAIHGSGNSNPGH